MVKRVGAAKTKQGIVRKANRQEGGHNRRAFNLLSGALPAQDGIILRVETIVLEVSCRKNLVFCLGVNGSDMSRVSGQLQ